MERNLRRIKHDKTYPKNPINGPQVLKTFENPMNKNKFGMNLRKTDNFYVDTIETDHGEWFSLFASYPLIRLIESYIPPEDRRYLIDGTFKVRPLGNFYQLVVIYIEFKNDVSGIWVIENVMVFLINISNSQFMQVFPIFYVLMTDKSAASYKAVFHYIESNIFRLQPSQFMADFESGLRAAIWNF